MYTPIRYVYALDGQEIYAKTDESGKLADQKEIEVFNGSITPGNHTLSVQMVYQGNGYGVFSYLKGYKFTAKSSRTFTAPEGKQLQLKVVGFEKGNPVTTDPKDRPAVDFREHARRRQGHACRSRRRRRRSSMRRRRCRGRAGRFHRILRRRRGARADDDRHPRRQGHRARRARSSTSTASSSRRCRRGRRLPTAASSTRRCSTSSRTTKRRRSSCSTSSRSIRRRRPIPRRSIYLADSLFLKRDYLSSRRFFEKIVEQGPHEPALPGGAAAAHRSGAAHERLLARRRLHREAERDAGGQAAAVGALRRGQVLLLPPAVRQGAGDAQADRPRPHLLFPLAVLRRRGQRGAWAASTSPTRSWRSAPS